MPAPLARLEEAQRKKTGVDELMACRGSPGDECASDHGIGTSPSPLSSRNKKNFQTQEVS